MKHTAPHPSNARRRAALAAPLALLAGAVLPRSFVGAAEVGQSAPPLQLPGTAGPVDLKAWQGQVVFVDFWASWCGPCKLSFPWMDAMQLRHGGRGLRVLAVNLDRQRADADAFLARLQPRFAVAFDAGGDTARRYDVKAMPTSVLVGADGQVVRHHAGFKDDDKAPLEAAIVAALGRAK